MSGNKLIRLVFDSLNILAVFGWLYVTYLVFVTPSTSIISIAKPPVFALEAICLLEVLRIVIGDLPGNILFGVLLHLIRMIALLLVFPRTSIESSWLASAILGSWSVTEVSRYPMYIVKGSKFARLLRMVVPMATFPIGCFTEAYSAWLVFRESSTPILVKIPLLVLVVINGGLGPVMAYPHVLKKGLKEMGFSKKKKSDKAE